MDVSFVDQTAGRSWPESEFQYHVIPSFWIALSPLLMLLSSFSYNLVTPWVFPFLRMCIAITSGISCLFFVVPLQTGPIWVLPPRAIRSTLTLLACVRITAL
jgi:hypothetical protein